MCCNVENARCSDKTVSCIEEEAGNSHVIPIGKGDMPFRGFGRRFLRILKSATPPIEEQAGIVERLGCWEELAREIELRQKQFEYYRDKLVD